ncbi:MAG: hypothetical protein Q7R95_06380 [bacterium]|nr:hypothetical protein [bacterium]
MNIINKTKEILFNGSISDDKLIIVDLNFSYKPTVRTSHLIETGWSKAIVEMKRDNRKFYNAPLVRCEKVILEKDTIRIRVSSGITYKDVIGLRANQFETFIDFGKNETPNALSVMNIVITADNFILIRWRHEGDWEGSYEVAGGFMKPDNPHDSFGNARTHLFRDYGFSRVDIKEHKLFSIVYFPQISETMQMFILRLNLSKKDILKKDMTYDKIHFLSTNIEEYRKFKETESIHLPSELILNHYFDL